MKETSQNSAPKVDHCRVRRGEPGCHVVTPLRDGDPFVENPPVALAPSSSFSLPPVIPEETKAIALSPYDEIAHWRASLILAFNEEASRRTGLKREFVNRFLKGYNSGSLLPDIYKKLGALSTPTLYRWISAFAAQGIDGLVPQYGGAGQSKITDHEKNVLLALLLHQNRLKVAYAITLTKEFLKKRGIESPSSSSTLRRFADEFKKEHYDVWVIHREGEKALCDKVLPYAERDWKLLEVGEGLVADGHRLNFQVINPNTGKPCRAALVLFWDWRSSYPLGWELMLEESTQCVASALRNAILALGKIPKWVYLDNGKAFKAKIFTEDINFEDSELPGMFARLNINYHFAQPYNAQAKPIERIFGILNEQLERMVPSYTGASINDKPAWTKRNEKIARSAHNPWVPTIPETNDLIFAWRDRYAERPSRGRDSLRPVDIFNEGKGAGVDPAELIYLMMEREIKQVHRNGVTWLGWHWFNEAMYGLRDKVLIRYSLSDLSQTYVFHKNEFLCVAKPVELVHPMASESENPKDMEAVKEVFRLKKKVKNTTRKLCDLLETKEASQIDWSRTRNAEISETIQKIEDSKKRKAKFISLFDDEPVDEKSCVAPPEEGKIDMMADHGSPLSCPWFKDDWEIYEWYYVHPHKLNFADLAFIDRHEDGYSGRHLECESGQRHLKYLLSERPGEAEYDAEDGKDGRDYRLGCDPAIEGQWRDIKNSIAVDPISGLSRPGEEIPLKNERRRYEFYRGIEKRFPGTLTDNDWGEVKKYEATRDWEFIFYEYEIYSLPRTIVEQNDRVIRPTPGDQSVNIEGET